MTKRDPLAWMVGNMIELTNRGGQNVLLDLPSGLLRLDKGRTVRITATAGSYEQVKALLDSGELAITSYCKR